MKVGMDWALRLPSVWRVMAWACLRPPWHTAQAAVVRRNCAGETVQTKARAQLDLQTREELLPPRSPVAVPGRAPVVGGCVSPSERQGPMG